MALRASLAMPLRALRALRAPAAAAAVASTLLSPVHPALAAGEQEWQVSAQVGFASVSVDGRSPWGPQLGLEVQYGFSDAWAVHLSADLSLHSVDANQEMKLPGGRVRAMAGTAGLTYTFDVLRFAPYADLGVGLLGVQGAVTQESLNLGVQAGVGADYYLSRRWVLGFSIRYLFAPAALSAFPPDFGGSPPYSFSIGAKACAVF